jgi:formylmethanofuran dehydrogenase subunit E
MEQLIWEKCVDFHGHECPGLAIGYRACELAIERLKLDFSVDEEVVCITENDACGVDAIQVITGCTMGKGNLIYKGTGKMAFSFYNRKEGTSIRLISKAFSGEMSKEERKKWVLNVPLETLFDIKEVTDSVPEIARLFESIACEQCGESAPEHKMRLNKGKNICLDCFQSYDRGWK